ncbi:DUF1097 domain-containing protein [Tepidibacter hydrothermalis]|uniref:DUF1097 domain-containing protein n=1 Tax=Tepidibacter hydrothermalis TaxID=3036126 RepID=A0ABY8E873_9FIRM|nr:DUF1097 domain-containing protein [Tepidibacter hydrothermalis]WFD09111.1 DUF1097 domain-containing protein [Tepidibacter hydrothermalis]
MIELFLASLFSAIIAFTWSNISSLGGIFIWVGFAGWTSFCITDETDSIKKMIKSYSCNLSGIFWATVTIYISSLIDVPIVTNLLTCGVATFALIYQSRFKIFSCVPCNFIGCFITFALNGDFKMAAIGLLCGAILGYISDKTSLLVTKIKSSDSAMEKVS